MAELKFGVGRQIMTNGGGYARNAQQSLQPQNHANATGQAPVEPAAPNGAQPKEPVPARTSTPAPTTYEPLRYQVGDNVFHINDGPGVMQQNAPKRPTNGDLVREWFEKKYGGQPGAWGGTGLDEAVGRVHVRVGDLTLIFDRDGNKDVLVPHPNNPTPDKVKEALDALETARANREEARRVARKENRGAAEAEGKKNAEADKAEGTKTYPGGGPELWGGKRCGSGEVDLSGSGGGISYCQSNATEGAEDGKPAPAGTAQGSPPKQVSDAAGELRKQKGVDNVAVKKDKDGNWSVSFDVNGMPGRRSVAANGTITTKIGNLEHVIDPRTSRYERRVDGEVTTTAAKNKQGRYVLSVGGRSITLGEGEAPLPDEANDRYVILKPDGRGGFVSTGWVSFDGKRDVRVERDAKTKRPYLVVDQASYDIREGERPVPGSTPGQVLLVVDRKKEAGGGVRMTGIINSGGRLHETIEGTDATLVRDKKGTGFEVILNPKMTKDGKIDLPKHVIDPAKARQIERALDGLRTQNRPLAAAMAGGGKVAAYGGDKAQVTKVALRDGRLHVSMTIQALGGDRMASTWVLHPMKDGGARAYHLQPDSPALRIDFPADFQTSKRLTLRGEKFEVTSSHRRNKDEWTRVENAGVRATEQDGTYETVKTLGKDGLGVLMGFVELLFAPTQSAVHGLVGSYELGASLVGDDEQENALQRAHALYTYRQATLNKIPIFNGADPTSRKVFLDAYGSLPDHMSDEQFAFVNETLDTFIKALRAKPDSSLGDIFGSGAGDYEQRAFAAALYFGLARVPAQQFEMGSKAVDRGDTWTAVKRYGTGATAIFGQGLVDGLALGMLMSPLKAAAAMRAAGMTAEQLVALTDKVKKLGKAAQITQQEAKALKVMGRISLVEAAVFLPLLGSGLAGVAQAYLSGDQQKGHEQLMMTVAGLVGMLAGVRRANAGFNNALSAAVRGRAGPPVYGPPRPPVYGPLPPPIRGRGGLTLEEPVFPNRLVERPVLRDFLIDQVRQRSSKGTEADGPPASSAQRFVAEVGGKVFKFPDAETAGRAADAYRRAGLEVMEVPETAETGANTIAIFTRPSLDPRKVFEVDLAQELAYQAAHQRLQAEGDGGRLAFDIHTHPPGGDRPLVPEYGENAGENFSFPGDLRYFQNRYRQGVDLEPDAVAAVVQGRLEGGSWRLNYNEMRIDPDLQFRLFLQSDLEARPPLKLPLEGGQTLGGTIGDARSRTTTALDDAFITGAYRRMPEFFRELKEGDIKNAPAWRNPVTGQTAAPGHWMDHLLNRRDLRQVLEGERRIIDTVNRPEFRFTGIYAKTGRSVDVYVKKGTVVVTRAGQKRSIITAFGEGFYNRNHISTPVRSVEKWIWDPNYVEVQRFPEPRLETGRPDVMRKWVNQGRLAVTEGREYVVEVEGAK